MRALTVLALFVVCGQFAQAQETLAAGGSADLIEVTAFVVRLEAKTSQLMARKDLCLSFDTRLEIRERDVVSKLREGGLAVHPHEWCNHGPRGFRFSVGAPIKRAVDGVYEVVVDVGDLTIRPGEHFATTLREGTYRVKLEKGSQPEMISYQKTCCPRE
jgi:hypothetical protein